MLGHRFTVVFRRQPPARVILSDQPFRSQQCLNRRAPFYHAVRCYATPGRPKKAVGEPSRPVKRAVKRAAKAATDPDSPAKERVERKKKDASEKKPAGTKTAKVAGAKKPVKVKAKKPVAKKVPKERTDEQKARAAARLEKAELRDLRKAALEPPAFKARYHAYNVFVKEQSKGLKGMTGDLAEIRAKIGDNAKKAGAEWKQLAPADIEHYNHLAHTEREAQQAAYKHWVEEHTPEQIHVANRARRSLRRKVPAKKGCSSPWAPIHDERAAKQPLTGYVQFTVNRSASGDFKNISAPDRFKLIAQEWKALDESEKKKYKELYKQDTARYVSEHSDTYGYAPPFAANGGHLDQQQPQAAAAAA